MKEHIPVICIMIITVVAMVLINLAPSDGESPQPKPSQTVVLEQAEWVKE